MSNFYFALCVPQCDNMIELEGEGLGRGLNEGSPKCGIELYCAYWCHTGKEM